MAVLGRQDGCSYHFCRKVLQARWLMRCNHGRTPLRPEPELFYEPVLHIDASMELAARSPERPDGPGGAESASQAGAHPG